MAIRTSNARRRRELAGWICASLLGAVTLALLIGESRSDATPRNLWCEQHYASARTRAESSAVDQMLSTPNPGKHENINPTYCGDFRLALERDRATRAAKRTR